MSAGIISSLKYQLILSCCVIQVCALSSCCKEENIPSLLNKLGSSNVRERSQAALDLASCGSSAERAVPRLAQMLYDENPGVQSSVSYALRKIDTPEARKIMKAIDEERRKRRPQ